MRTCYEAESRCELCGKSAPSPLRAEDEVLCGQCRRKGEIEVPVKRPRKEQNEE
jgi:hypothetical protein